MYYAMPTDEVGIERELQRIADNREVRNEAATLCHLFNSSGITSVKYQGKNGRGVLLESSEQLEDLKRILGLEYSNPDQLSIVVNLRAKSWNRLQELASVTPQEISAEQKMWESLVSQKLSMQMMQETEADHVPARRTNKRAKKWYTENDDGDIVLVDMDTLEPDDEVCEGGSDEWITAQEAGLVAPKPARRRPAKRKAKPKAEVEAEAAESN